MVLILPDKKAQVVAGMQAPQDAKDSGIATVVACDEHPAMPDIYDPGNGQIAHLVYATRRPKVGDVILYRRVSSQVVTLENEDGSQSDYRVVSELDIAGYFDGPSDRKWLEKP